MPSIVTQAVDIVERYRKRQTVTITLDETKFTFRRTSVGDFMSSGKIPAPMLAFVIPMDDGTGTLKTRKPETPEDMIQYMDVIDMLLEQESRTPKIIAPIREKSGDNGQIGMKVYPELKPGEIGTWEIDDDDKAEAFRCLKREAGVEEKQAAPFRPVPGESGRGDEPASDGPGVRPAT